MGQKFDEQSAERIAATVKQFERSLKNESPQRRRQSIGNGNVVRQGLLLAGDTITARSGDVPGSGDITLQYFDGTLQDDGTNDVVTVYNPYGTEIGTDGTNDKPLQVAYGDGGEWWLLGGESACPTQNAILQVTVGGDPSGGTFTLTINADGTSDVLTFDYEDDSTAAKSVLETHANIASGDVAVSAGPWPTATMEIEFTGNLANTDIPVPTANWSGLTGGAGVFVITSLAQRGSGE